MVPGTNFTMVLLVNIPWTIFPLLLMYHVASSAPWAGESDGAKKIV
jgi:hypothetical protein